MQDKAHLTERVSLLKERSSNSDLFEYLKALIIELSHGAVTPEEVNTKYIETACRYCMPTLFDSYALLGDSELENLKDLDQYKNDMTVLSDIMQIIDMTHIGDSGGDACHVAKESIYSAVAAYVESEG